MSIPFHFVVFRRSVLIGEAQGAKKKVSTFPRQVVLASEQVGYQSYLSFGQVNLQKIKKNN